jgi:hypothetical protein
MNSATEGTATDAVGQAAQGRASFRCKCIEGLLVTLLLCVAFFIPLCSICAIYTHPIISKTLSVASAFWTALLNGFFVFYHVILNMPLPDRGCMDELLICAVCIVIIDIFLFTVWALFTYADFANVLYLISAIFTWVAHITTMLLELDVRKAIGRVVK